MDSAYENGISTPISQFNSQEKEKKVPSIWPVKVLLIRISADHKHICSATYSRDTWVCFKKHEAPNMNLLMLI